MTTPRGNKTGANPTQFTTSYAYNPLDQLTDVTDPLGRHQSWTYDADGNVASSTDPDSNTTSYTYDLADRLTQVTRPGGTTIGTGYDPNGNITTQTDPLGRVTSYTYDPIDRVTSSTDPLNRTASYVYDDAGNLATATNPAGKTTTYSYDDADQLTGIAYSDGTTPNVSFTHNTRGQVTNETNTSGFTRAYTYDTIGRLTATTDTRTTTAATQQQTVAYSYDLAGRITGITPCSFAGVCRTATRSYDDAGRMKTVNDGLGHTTTFTYDANSNLTVTAFGNGTTAIYSYNNADELTSTTAATATGQLVFPSPRNTRSLVTQDSQTGTPAGPTRFYSYDPLERLTGVGASTPNATATYSYDNADRITSWIDPTAARTFTYDNADQLTTLVSHPPIAPATSTTFTYDSQGNRLSQVETTSSTASLVGRVDYGYNQANRLTGVTLTNASNTNPTIQRYSYDSNGLRTDLNWDLAEGLPLVFNDEAGNAYLTGPDGLPIEQITPAGTTQYYIHDQLGSTRILTNQAGTITATYSYDAYGNPNTSANAPSNPFQYAGQYTDPITGLIYLRARWYDPTTGQFLSVDPIVDVTREPYSYVSNNPLNGTDPSGLYWGEGVVNKAKEVGGAVVEGGARVAGGVVKASPVGLVLDAASQLSGHSVGLCAGGSVFGGYDLSGSVCYMATPSGRSGFTVSAGGGGGAPWGVSGLVGVSVSNARNSSDFSGTGGYGWASGGEGPYGAGASASFSRNDCGEGIWQTTVGWAPGIRIPAPFSFGGGASHTWTPGW